ncbi:hypothetical protein ABMB44_14695 [Levilactobacillus brevis]
MIINSRARSPNRDFTWVLFCFLIQPFMRLILRLNPRHVKALNEKQKNELILLYQDKRKVTKNVTKAQIDKQTVNGDSKDLAFTVTYTKNAPTMTTEKKTVNETVSYVDQNGHELAKPHTASVDFTRQVSTDAVTGVT